QGGLPQTEGILGR
ncbi:hypothetical protein E2320_007389, partial [Naja naja]